MQTFVFLSSYCANHCLKASTGTTEELKKEFDVAPLILLFIFCIVTIACIKIYSVERFTYRADGQNFYDQTKPTAVSV